RRWIKQLNLLAAYLYFFNPLRMLLALVRSRSNLPLADADTRSAAEIARYSPLQRMTRSLYLRTRAHLLDAAIQGLGMAGLFQTLRRTLPWAWHLLRGNIQHSSLPPASRLPMRSPLGAPALHALPGTPLPAEPPRPQLLSIDAAVRSQAA